MNRKENAFELFIILLAACVLVMFHQAYVFTAWQLHYFVLLGIRLHPALISLRRFGNYRYFELVVVEHPFRNFHKRSMAVQENLLATLSRQLVRNITIEKDHN